ncbi:MAG: protoporphyrinogen oxidase [Gemmatimonadales bacterium]
MRVVVIGAGIAGLSAALALQRRARQENRALDLRVLEAGPQPGGHVGTLREDGFLIETGPNGFLSGQPAIDDLVGYLGLTSSLVETRPAFRRRFLASGGRLRRIPNTPVGLFTTRTLSLRGRLRLAMEPWIPPRRNGGEETVLEFGRRRFGPEAASVFADAIVAGTSAGSAATLSVDAAYPTLPDLERRYGSVVRGLMAERRRRGPKARFQSFALGMGTIVDAIVDRLGPVISLGDAVTGLTREAGGWWIARADRDPLFAERVIVAAPASRIACWFQYSDPALAALLREIPSAGVVAVAFAWREGDLARPLDGYGYLVPAREGLVTLGAVWESSLFPSRAPRGWVLVRSMLGGARTPGAIQLSDAELLGITEAETAPLLRARRPPSHAWVFRWPEAISQYLKGHCERVASIRRAAVALGGLEPCGSSYDGVSFTSALASGAAAADRTVLQ